MSGEGAWTWKLSWMTEQPNRRMFLSALSTVTIFCGAALHAGDEHQPRLTILDMSLPENASLDVDQYRWVNRLVVVFADSANDPRFREQMDNLQFGEEDLLDRDVVVLIDANPDTGSTVRQKYRPRGFVILLVGKDGSVALRKPVPWNVREIRNAIDKLPVRQQEMKSG